MFNESKDKTQDFFSLMSEKKGPKNNWSNGLFQFNELEKDRKRVSQTIVIYMFNEPNDERLGDVSFFLKSNKISKKVLYIFVVVV